MDRAKHLILPVGLLLALGVGILLPLPGAALGEAAAGPITWPVASVVVIFLINGISLQLAGARQPELLRATALAIGLNLLVAPVLAWAVLAVTEVPLGLAVGLAVMASVPTTLSSAAVIAVNAGGDRLWALTLTVAVVLVGSVTAPIAVSQVLSADVSVPAWPVLRQVLLTVLVPTVVGMAIRRWTPLRLPSWVQLVPSLAVISVVWVTMSQQSQAARGLSAALWVGVFVVALTGHAVLLGLGALAAHGRPVQQALPVLFVVGQKTLPVAVSMLVVLGDAVPQVGAALGLATLTCVAWHFLQVFLDSLLAGRAALRYSARGATPSSA